MSNNLKQLKLRIAGVKSTQKITKAMKMVSASKLIKAQDKKDRAKIYAGRMRVILKNVFNSAKNNNESFPLLNGTGKDDTHLIVVVSSDRGLCGAFNSSIIKNTKNVLRQLSADGVDFKVLCIGKKGYDSLKTLYNHKVIEFIPGFSNRKVDYLQANEIANKIITLFENKEFDICTVIYNEFQNAIKQDVRNYQLIPFSEDIADSSTQVFEYEPKEEKILEQILPKNIAIQLFYIILESVASEHGARMTAMDSATNNASSMIDNLTLLYNRSRQAAITKELIEIVSSAEAL